MPFQPTLALKLVCVIFHLADIPHTQGADPADSIVDLDVLSMNNTSDCKGCCPWGKAKVRTAAVGLVHKWEPSHTVAAEQHRRLGWLG